MTGSLSATEHKYTYKVSEKKLTELIEVMMTTYEINITEKGV